MKRIIKVLIGITILFILSSCNESVKVTLNYNCDNVENYDCRVVDSKLNCMILEPQCENYEFVGWYDDKGSGNLVDLDGNFDKSITIYAHYNGKGSTIAEPINPTNPIDPSKPNENIYTITFNSNGGSGGQSGSIRITYGSSMPGISTEKPIKNGYTFMGWYDNANYLKGTQYYNANGISVTKYYKQKDITLYAGWSKIGEETYVITFNANGGSGAMAPQKVTNNTTVLLNENKFTRNGYTFIGWKDINGNSYSNKGSIKVIKNTTLYAQWKQKETAPSTYTISFNANGGSGGQSSNVTVTYGNSMPSISTTKPIRNGYVFEGWYDNANYLNGNQYYNASGISVTKYYKNSNTTLYAGWSKENIINCMITFLSNDGTDGKMIQSAVMGQNTKLNSNTFTKLGYTFVNWNTASNGSGTSYNNNSTIILNSNITLYAQWRANTYNIEYILNGATLGNNSPKSALYDKLITISNPSKKYTVTIDNNGTNSSLSSTSVVANQTFIGWAYTNGNSSTAQYRNNNSEINTSWTNGNTKVTATQFQNLRSESGIVKLTAYFNNNVIKLPTTTKNGYTCGYSTVSNASVISYSSGSNYIPTNNIKLYVICNKNAPTTYTIKFNGNNATNGSMQDQIVTANTATTINSNNYTRTGYTFSGWNTASNGSGTSYSNKGTITLNSNITLYAQWKKNGVFVKFASFNVGYFECGSSSIRCYPSVNDFVNLIKQNNIDVIGMQEARNGWDTTYARSIGNNSGLSNILISYPANVNAILSKYSFINTSDTSMACGEKRSLAKVIIEINGVKISYYNTHLGLSNCNEEHFAKVASIVKDDPNPVVMTADYNHVDIDRFNKYFTPLGFKIAAYDTLTHNMWNKPSYCDAVLVNPKGHIDIISSETIDVYATYSDHNLVIATLSVY